MTDILILCHGNQREFGVFDLKKDQAVLYRGNFGALLGVGAAKRLVTTLLQDPLIGDKELAKEIPNYKGAACAGPGTFKPDIELSGDDNLLCFIMNLHDGRWWRLGSGFKSKLSEIIAGLGDGPFTVNLLCCTLSKDSGAEAPTVDKALQVKDWPALFKK